MSTMTTTTTTTTAAADYNATADHHATADHNATADYCNADEQQHQQHQATRAAALADAIALVRRQGMRFVEAEEVCAAAPAAESEEEEVFLALSRATGKVATAIRLTPARVFTAFTTKDPLFNDNFDYEAGRTVPVENCTFGAGKVYVETCEIFGFCNDPIGHPDAYVKTLLPKFSAMGVPSSACERLYAALDDPAATESGRMNARREFLARDVLAPRVAATDAALLALARKKGITAAEDPLVRACEARVDTLKAEEDDADASTAFETVTRYCTVRMELLADVADTNPRLAKLALGRMALFPLLQDIWTSPEVDLGAWAVQFVRRYFMARNPDHAYLFCLLHRHGLACEVSDCDDLWAKKVAENANKQAGALCFALTWPCADLLNSIEAAAPTRKLGAVNRRVARALLCLPAESSETSQGTAAFAEAYLTRCGWAAWFNRTIIAARQLGDAGGSGSSIFPQAALVLPPPLRAAIVHSTLADVRAALRALVAAGGC